MSERIIEISGRDYIGKSTQADLLTYWSLQNCKNLGGLGSFARGIPTHQTEQEQWNWWFRDTSFEELSGTLVDAYVSRQDAASKAPHDFVVVERGASMIPAQIAANFSTRTETAVEENVDRAMETTALTRRAAHSPRDEFVLQEESTWQNKIKHMHDYLRRANSKNAPYSIAQQDFYEQYQKNLAKVLQLISDTNDAVAIDVDGAAVDVQNKIRSHERIRDLRLPMILEREPVVVGLSGLSEAGKGSVAQYMSEQYGFTRLKLGFFNEISRDGEHYGDARTIAMNALHFIACNRHLERITFESLHGANLAAELKIMLGDRWKTVFIELADEERIDRLHSEKPSVDLEILANEQQEKDNDKIIAGILGCKALADVVVDNSGELSETVDTIVKEINL